MPGAIQKKTPLSLEEKLELRERVLHDAKILRLKKWPDFSEIDYNREDLSRPQNLNSKTGNLPELPTLTKIKSD